MRSRTRREIEIPRQKMTVVSGSHHTDARPIRLRCFLSAGKNYLDAKERRLGSLHRFLLVTREKSVPAELRMSSTQHSSASSNLTRSPRLMPPPKYDLEREQPARPASFFFAVAAHTADSTESKYKSPTSTTVNETGQAGRQAAHRSSSCRYSAHPR